jgi:glucose/arabinose dehydrogenase
MENVKNLVLIIVGVGIIALALIWNSSLSKNPNETPQTGNGQNGNTENPTQGQNTTGIPLTLPEGFSISNFASGLGSPRMITFDEAGNMLVSITSGGRVVALPDKNNDNKSDQTITVLSGLSRPHGIAVRCAGQCKLYVAEENQLASYDYDPVNYKATNKTKLMDMPSGGGHFTRTVKVGPDERLYVSIGSSCNVCDESDNRRSKIFSLKTDGTDLKEVARGLRNSVFFTWSFVDGRMWATEMGRDNLGDNTPPDEINIIEQGKNYGWPNCYGKNIHDGNFDKKTYIRNPCMEPYETESKVDLQAHSAPLGLDFIPEEGWSEDMWYDLVVAYHGSWNRSVPTGYKLVRIKLDDKGNYNGTEDFITGFHTGSSVLGRPVDVLIQSGGIMYVSDDKAGNIYRITSNFIR